MAEGSRALCNKQCYSSSMLKIVGLNPAGDTFCIAICENLRCNIHNQLDKDGN